MLGLLAIFQLLACCKGNFIHPTPTVHDGTTPTAMIMPTSPPRRRQVGFMNAHELFPRDLPPVTCGYMTYDPAEPLECPGDQVCAFENESSSYWGPVCCPTQTNGLVIPACSTSALVTCIDYGDAGNDFRPMDATSYSRALYCGYDFPICGTLQMTITSPVSITGLYTSFFCGISESWTISAYQETQLTLTQISSAPGTTVSVTTTLLDTTTAPNPVANDAANNDASSNSSTSSSTESANRSTSTDRREPGSEGNTKPSTAAPTGESHTAAIAGGVGGGIGGALAIAGIIGYLVHRKRKQRREKVPEIAT